MSMLWPGFLALLGLIPVTILAYIWALRRRRRFAVRYSSLTLVREALPRQSRLRRHLPFALFLLAMASLIVAFSRPMATVYVPKGEATIILALDVSRSMCATDIRPNRLEAAKAAANSYIQRQALNTQVGIVAFAGFAELIQPPTTDQEALHAAIDSLNTGRRTAIGSGIMKAIDAIAEIDNKVAPSTNGMSTEVEPTPVPEGVFAPHIIVLLTDGVSNTGPDPLYAAEQARARGIRVYTIGFGSDNNNVPMPFCGRGFEGGDFYGGGMGFGGFFRRGIDEETLKQIASLTGGKYYPATSSAELQKVFHSLPTNLNVKQESLEISVAFTALGAFLAAIAIGLGFLWHPLT